MSFVGFRDAEQLARKSYVCDCCGFTIPAGKFYARRTYMFDGELVDEKLHPWCRALLELFIDDGRADDGFQYEELAEFEDELIRDHGYEAGDTDAQ